MGNDQSAAAARNAQNKINSLESDLRAERERHQREQENFRNEQRETQRKHTEQIGNLTKILEQNQREFANISSQNEKYQTEVLARLERENQDRIQKQQKDYNDKMNQYKADEEKRHKQRTEDFKKVIFFNYFSSFAPLRIKKSLKIAPLINHDLIKVMASNSQ